MKLIKRAVCFFLIVTFVVTSLYIPDAHAQVFLPPVGTRLNLSPAFTPDIIRGMTIDPKNPFAFSFLVDQGDKPLPANEQKDAYLKLIKYFMAAMTIAEDKQWVNLSPYEGKRIIDNDFGKTEMGRDLLGQDYILKQLTASLLYPEDALGKEFWQKVYKEAAAKYGTTQIPVNTFNKVWIVPETASVYEKDDTVLIVNSKLKVMLEEDYLSTMKHENIHPAEGTQNIARKVLSEIIIPALTKEVNEGKNFANLRQIYHSMILATWYKQALRKSILTQVYANKNKVKGVDLANPLQAQQQVYQQYLKAFKKGAYNFIKEEVDPLKGQVMPRKYFSGGFIDNAVVTEVDEAMAAREFKYNPLKLLIVSVGLTLGMAVILPNSALANSSEDTLRMPISTSTKNLEKAILKTFEDLQEINTSLSFGLIKVGGFLNLEDKGKITEGKVIKIVRANGKYLITTEDVLGSLDYQMNGKLHLFEYQPKTEKYLESLRYVRDIDKAQLSDEDLAYLKTTEDKLYKLLNSFPAFISASEMDEIIEKLNLIIKKPTTISESSRIVGLKEEAEGLLRFEVPWNIIDPQLTDRAMAVKKMKDFFSNSKLAGRKRTAIIYLSVSIALISLHYYWLSTPFLMAAFAEWTDNKEYKKEVIVLLNKYQNQPEVMNIFLEASEALLDSEVSYKDKRERIVFLDQLAEALPVSNPYHAECMVLLAQHSVLAKKELEDSVEWYKEFFKSRKISIADKEIEMAVLKVVVEELPLGDPLRIKYIDLIQELQGYSRDKSKRIFSSFRVKYPELHDNDAALIAKASPTGGIDLNSANLNLNIKRDGNGVPLPLGAQDQAMLNAPGFVPVITDIRPAVNLPILTELKALASHF